MKVLLSLLLFTVSAHAAVLDTDLIQLANRSDLILFDDNDAYTLANPHPACGPQVRSYLKNWDLDSYLEAALQGDQTVMDRLGKGPIRDLEALESKQDPCFESVALAYSLRSLNLSRFRTLGIAGGFNSLEDRSAFAVAVLARSKRIRFLSHGERKKLGTGWTDRTPGKAYKILGAYDCATSTIWIDPMQRPFNLASVWIHELAHLFRDQFHFSGQVKAGSAPVHKNISAKDYLLLDESMAVALSGIRQRYMRFGGDLPFKDFWNSQGDLDLYQSRGPLEKLWQYSRVDRFFAWEHDIAFHDFLKHTIFWQPDPNPLADAYSPSSRIGFQLRFKQRLESKNYGKNLRKKLQDYLDVIEKGYFGSKLDKTAIDRFWKLNWFDALAFEPYFAWGGVSSPRTRAEILETLEILSDPPKVSSSCTWLKDEAKKKTSEIHSYLGLQLGSEVPVDPAGNDGVRPAGNDGVRPNGPVWPGNDGVRPTTSVRPCLNLDKI